MLDNENLNVKQYRDHIESLRSSHGEFSHLSDQVYLDHAASTIYMSSLIGDYQIRLTDAARWSLFSNPHSHSQSGEYTSSLIDSVREKILAVLFGTSSAEYDLVFVANATAGLKLLGECLRPACLAYLADNHTSVIGMRQNEAHVYCVYEEPDGKFHFKLVKSSSQIEWNSPNLFVFPAQSNFNGRRYDLKLIEKIQNKSLDNLPNQREWFVCLDAASLIATSSLSLKMWKPDFVVISFYKLFGFPTGLGALLIKKDDRLKHNLTSKKYFGGGTIDMALIDADKVCVKNFTCHELRTATSFSFHDAFEDGTLPYLEIIAVGIAIEKFQNLTFGLGFDLIHSYLSKLTEYLVNQLVSLKHFNEVRLVEIYRNKSSVNNYGPIITFNLKNSKENYIGFKLVEKLAQESRIHLRTGCFCNIGACQIYLPHLNVEENFYFSHGHKCGDHIDLIDGKPVGAIRVSLGYCSTQTDCDNLVEFLRTTFLDLSYVSDIHQNIVRTNKVVYFKIKSIYIYPIKSCAAMSVSQKWQFSSSSGEFLYDRQWIVVDDFMPLSQKRTPGLARLQPCIELNKNILSIRYLDDLFELSLDNEKHTNIWIGKDGLRGYDQGDEVSEWLSRVLDKRCRLIRCLESAANKAEFLLVNEKSLKRLSACLNHEQTQTLALQFRPNLVVEDLIDHDDDFSEEKWTHIRMLSHRQPAVEFDVVENCVRCHVINIDQTATQQSCYSTLLKQLYKLKQNSRFGIYLKRLTQPINDRNPRELEVGDIGLARV